MILTVPRDESLWPTLGPQVCDFIESNMGRGPGDFCGQPVLLDDDWVGFIYRMYEVFPRGHELAGRRRFKRVGLSLPKGMAKTEHAAMIAICELHPDAPVRCIGWTKDGEPIGGPVADPYIPVIAYTQEQSDELCFSAMRKILENSRLKDDLDLANSDRITRRKGGGKAEALSANPSARDGARTTFTVLDETHRWTLPRQRQAHTVMKTNIPKRKIADGWMLEVTTAYEPGRGSVAEATMDYARAVHDGRVKDSTLFFYHREASAKHDLTIMEGRLAAITEVAGSASRWRDNRSIAVLWDDPEENVAYLERVYLNRLVRDTAQAFDVVLWEKLAKPNTVKPGDLIVAGFDGSQFHDSTAIVCTHIESGFQWKAGLWECPLQQDPAAKPWQVPAEEVDATVRALFEQYTIWRFYADPPYWQSWIAAWTAEFGEERVIEWWTNRRKAMSAALENFDTAIRDGELQHDGDKDLKRHLGNARKKELPQVGEDGRHLWLIEKERQDSPHKIDLCMAAVLSWEARTDAIAAGAIRQPTYDVMVLGGRR